MSNDDDIKVIFWGAARAVWVLRLGVISGMLHSYS